MTRTSALFVLGIAFALSTSVFAEDKCNVKTVLGGKPVTMKYCAASVYDSGPSVTLWFSDAPFSAKELEAFHESSATPDKTPEGKPRTQLHFSFCPGGGKPAASAAAVKSVETSIDVAGAPFSGRQWVFDLPKDKDILKIEKLTGSADAGAKFSGRITGGKVSDGLKYSWEADFDFTLPAKFAFAGQGCGS